MGELGAFLKLSRVENPERVPAERVLDYHEFVNTLADAGLAEQGARCMECGVPFCHNGCPVNNLIPDWNDSVFRGRWEAAIEQLHRTNNFPDFTGRLCPAPCEAACVLEIREGEAVTIKQIELAIVNRAWEEGWIGPRPPIRESGHSVAVIGAGPAGMACAQQLRRAGHAVTVFERDEAGGGLVRFGVPDFKIEKWIVERRVQQLAEEGVVFRFGAEVGGNVPADELRGFDAVVIATGSRVPRDLPVPGRDLAGVHFAMDYLYQRNRFVAREEGPTMPGAPVPPAGAAVITAAGKDVIVIGGGDTGADCVANAHREGAASVTQIELIGEPPRSRPDEVTPWPRWPMKLRIPYALKEGGERDFAISTTEFTRLERTCRGDPLDPERRRPAIRPDPRHGGEPPRRPGAARDGLPGPRDGTARAARRRSRRAHERQGGPLRVVRPRHLRRRRRPPGPVTDRVGDQRGPPLRAGRRAASREDRGCLGRSPSLPA